MRSRIDTPEHRRAALSLMRDGHPIATRHIARRCKLTTRQAYRLLRQMENDGLVRRVGPNAGLWKKEDTKKMKSEKALENELQARGLTAPRVTPEMLDAEIELEEYHLFFGSLLTVCVLTLRNGFPVSGESACASPENFDAEIGQQIARQNAREKIWPLLGFRLRDQLASEKHS